MTTKRRRQGALRRWYLEVRRDLPWRRTRDPYRIWVSEVMLQQTRVETALPYYRRFVARWPTVEALAEAELDEVLALWSGLGYYRRARSLHRAARAVVEGGGELPRTADEWRRLPGVGEYTAAAIASIAAGEPVPVLDGNVVRVLARYLALEEEVEKASARRRLRAAAEELLDRERPGDGNQALMELGATLCRVREPECGACPLAPGCEAHRRGQVDRFPRSRRRRARVKRRRLVALCRRRGRVLLFRRRRGEEPLGGLWEMPWTELPAASPEESLGRRYGGRWRLGESLGRVRHSITYRDLELEIREAAQEEVSEIAEGLVEAGWFHPSRLSGLPLSSQVLKVLRLTGVSPAPSADPGRRPPGRSS